MRVRKLNTYGIKEFTGFVTSLRSGSTQNLPQYLLDSDEASEAIEMKLDVREKEFSSRYEMGVYLVDLFAGHNVQPYLGDIGFWSWFGLFWFEQLCPVSKGRWRPSMEYNYILSKDYKHRPRHAIYMTWQLVNRYREDAKFILCKEPSTRGELAEQLMARQDILTSQGAMRLASSLYMDLEAGTFKRGAAARKSAGCVARYIRWLQQIRRNYDIFSMTNHELEELLPKEFDRFREPVV